jgi:hypothetical protein
MVSENCWVVGGTEEGTALVDDDAECPPFRLAFEPSRTELEVGVAFPLEAMELKGSKLFWSAEGARDGSGIGSSLGEVSVECVVFRLDTDPCCFPLIFLKYVSSLICDLPLNPYDLTLDACSCWAPNVRKDENEEEVGGGEAICDELVDPFNWCLSRVMVLSLDWERMDGLDVDWEILLRFR